VNIYKNSANLKSSTQRKIQPLAQSSYSVESWWGSIIEFLQHAENKKYTESWRTQRPTLASST